MKIGIHLRRIARQPVKLGEWNGALALGTGYLNHGIQCRQRHTHVAWMHGDAFLARAEDGMNAVIAVLSGTPAARRTLIALFVTGIVEVVTTGSLQQVAAHSRHVPKLL